MLYVLLRSWSDITRLVHKHLSNIKYIVLIWFYKVWASDLENIMKNDFVMKNKQYRNSDVSCIAGILS